MFLNSDKLNEIEAKSFTLLENTFSKNITLPINLKKILDNFDFKLQIGDFKDPNIAGVYVRETKVILISKEAKYERNAFTIAHELGHYFLHDDVPDEVFDRLDADLINSPEKNLKELEANWFAASLLMPKVQLKVYSLLFNQNLDKLAGVFGVSKTAMLWRFNNLIKAEIS